MTKGDYLSSTKNFNSAKIFIYFKTRFLFLNMILRCTKSDALDSIVPGLCTIITFVCWLTWMRIDQKVETAPWTERISPRLLILNNFVSDAFNIIATHTCSIIAGRFKNTSIDGLTGLQSTNSVDVISSSFSIIWFPGSIWISVSHCTSKLAMGQKSWHIIQYDLYLKTQILQIHFLMTVPCRWYRIPWSVEVYSRMIEYLKIVKPF